MTKKRRRTQRPLPVRVTAREDGRLALLVDGVTQSVALPMDDASPCDGYWPLMLPDRCPERALILGLGGGTLAALLARRCPGAAMVGVEHNAAVLAAARDAFGLEAIARLEVVEADAFSWVEAQAAGASTRYDFIGLDLFSGGRLAPGALARPFLRQLALMLREQGTISVNLMRTGRLSEQLHRIESVFTIERRALLWGNVVLHLRIPSVATEFPDQSSPATH